MLKRNFTKTAILSLALAVGAPAAMAASGGTTAQVMVNQATQTQAAASEGIRIELFSEMPSADTMALATLDIGSAGADLSGLETEGALFARITLMNDGASESILYRAVVAPSGRLYIVSSEGVRTLESFLTSRGLTISGAGQAMLGSELNLTAQGVRTEPMAAGMTGEAATGTTATTPTATSPTAATTPAATTPATTPAATAPATTPAATEPASTTPAATTPATTTPAATTPATTTPAATTPATTTPAATTPATTPAATNPATTPAAPVVVTLPPAPMTGVTPLTADFTTDIGGLTINVYPTSRTLTPNPDQFNISADPAATDAAYNVSGNVIMLQYRDPTGTLADAIESVEQQMKAQGFERVSSITSDRTTATDFVQTYRRGTTPAPNAAGGTAATTTPAATTPAATTPAATTPAATTPAATTPAGTTAAQAPGTTPATATDNTITVTITRDAAGLIMIQVDLEDLVAAMN